MLPRSHHADDSPELGEVGPLLGLERVLLEERDDALEQMLLPSHPIRHPVAVVPANHATTEVRLECVENLRVALVLNDGELREHLVAAGHVGMRIDLDVEAAFTVHESRDPLRFEVHRGTRTSSL